MFLMEHNNTPGGMMLTRLRQRSNVGISTISGSIAAKTYPWKQYISFTLPFYTGERQAVFDSYKKGTFQKRLLSGVPPLHDVTMSKLRYFVPAEQPVNYEAQNTDYIWKFSGGSLAAAPFSSNALGVFQPPTNEQTLYFTQVDVNVASYLLQRAYSRMSSAEYDFGVTIGEIAETASMLAKPLHGIAKLSSLAFAGCKGIYKDGSRVVVKVAKNATSRQLRVLRRATIQHPVNSSLRLVDETANHWLAYKFGVLPLVEDVGKVLDFAKENVSPTFGLRVARVKGRKVDKTTSTQMDNAVLYSPYWDTLWYDVLAIKREVDQHTCGLYWRNNITAPIVNFLENIGFSPFQLPSLAYELIPLSFVVDRFIDIKSFIRGNIGSLSKDTYGNFTTRKVETVYSYALSNVRVQSSPAAPRVKVSQALNSVAYMEQMARSINTERPKFPVVNPYLRDQLTADMTNLSLIWGRLRTFVGKL